MPPYSNLVGSHLKFLCVATAGTHGTGERKPTIFPTVLPTTRTVPVVRTPLCEVVVVFERDPTLFARQILKVSFDRARRTVSNADVVAHKAYA